MDSARPSAAARISVTWPDSSDRRDSGNLGTASRTAAAWSIPFAKSCACRKGTLFARLRQTHQTDLTPLSPIDLDAVHAFVSLHGVFSFDCP